MNSFNPKTFKKLLVIFALSILIILLFLVVRIFFPIDTEVELKSFNTQKVDKSITHKIQDKTQDKNQTRKKFMLLPVR